MSWNAGPEAESENCGEPSVELVLHGKKRDLGGLLVRRVLPAIGRRRVGPFTFLDHMGPLQLPPGQGLDVRPHPHIGLATVTYLFDGELIHRDSMGVEQTIRPGELNWMHAGKGVTHSERSGPKARAEGARAHGMQAWVALPEEFEESEPFFRHHERESLPQWELPGMRLCLVAGEAYGRKAPVEPFSPLFYLDADVDTGAELVLPAPDEHQERAAYVVSGEMACGEERFRTGDLVVFRPGVRAGLQAREASRVMLLGGAPLVGERFMDWNFVSSSRARIEKAKQDWADGRFPKVPGDEREFIPLPR